MAQMPGFRKKGLLMEEGEKYVTKIGERTI